MSAADTLRKAAQLIEDRAVQRDRPDGEKSMLATVTAFNAIYSTTLTETQGWHFMELLKMVRSAYGVHVPDDYEDKVAYAALAAESAATAEGTRRANLQLSDGYIEAAMAKRQAAMDAAL